jgi:deazaflavin-dependent oxidoreductase (nitroreductase family)
MSHVAAATTQLPATVIHRGVRLVFTISPAKSPTNYGTRRRSSPESLRIKASMPPSLPAFRAPSAGERVFNRIFGFLVGLGIGFSHNYLLQVRGRKSGKIYSTPIDLLKMDGKRFLVAPRGRTQWVRNAEAAGEVTLKKGSTRLQFRLRPIPDADKLKILKGYLDTFKREVQRYFPVPAGSPPEAFRELASGYPVFELLPV